MKYSAGFYTLIAIVTIFFFPLSAYADTAITVSNNGSGSTSDVHVSSQSQGTSTICQNGNCTTTGGGSHTTYCYNGQCTTVDNGSVDYNSPDGHTQIHVNNNTSDNSASISPAPSASTPTETPEPTVSVEPSVTPDPTIAQMRKDINTHVQKEIDGIKEHMKDQNAAISSFMQEVQKFFDSLFK